MTLIVIAALAAVVLGARWLEIHPESIVPKGHFASFNSPSARLFRVVVSFMGSFFIVFGVWGTVLTLRNLASVNSVALNLVAHVVGMSLGLVAAYYVRRETRLQQPTKPDSPYGWWP
jgi:hypothetical protein